MNTDFAVLNFVWLSSGLTEVRCGGKVYRPLIADKRRELFTREKACRRCGREAKKIILMRSLDPSRPEMKIVDAEGVILTVDHIYPRSQGGGNDLRNLMVLCESCNQMKRDKPITKMILEDYEKGIEWHDLPLWLSAVREVQRQMIAWGRP